MLIYLNLPNYTYPTYNWTRVEIPNHPWLGRNMHQYAGSIDGLQSVDCRGKALFQSKNGRMGLRFKYLSVESRIQTTEHESIHGASMPSSFALCFLAVFRVNCQVLLKDLQGFPWEVVPRILEPKNTLRGIPNL